MCIEFQHLSCQVVVIKGLAYLLTLFYCSCYWKTGLILAFTGKNYFRILGLGLGLACLWPWPWLTGLGLGLDTSGLVNIPVHAAYCYRPSSVVCWSVCRSNSLLVCHTSDPWHLPAKTAEAIEISFGWGLGWAQWTTCYMGPDPLMGRGNFKGGKGEPLECIATLYGHLCKNGWTDRGAIWVVCLDGPKESC